MPARPRTDRTPVILLGVLLCAVAAMAAVGLVAGAYYAFGKGKSGGAAGTSIHGPVAGTSDAGPIEKLTGEKFREIQQAFRANEAVARQKYLGRRYSLVVEMPMREPGRAGPLLVREPGLVFAVDLTMRRGAPAPFSTGRYAVVGTLTQVITDSPLGPNAAPGVLLDDAVATRLTSDERAP